MGYGHSVLILLLGGRAQRFTSELLQKNKKDTNATLPKQFHPLDSKKDNTLLFEASAKCLIKALNLDSALFVFPEQKDKSDLVSENLSKEVLTRLKNNFPDCEMMIIEGGATRHDSFQNSINFLQRKNLSPDHILIVHDANRPFLYDHYLKRIEKEIRKIGEKKPCSIPVIQNIDSLVLEGELGLEYLPREKVYRIQTPQLLYLKSVYEAFDEKTKKKLSFDWTDEGSFMKDMGFDVSTFKGDIQNKKVTYPMDLL